MFSDKTQNEHPFLVSSVPEDKPESWPEEFKTVVKTDSKNYTYGNLSQLFQGLETSEYKNVTDRFEKWRGEREVLDDPGVPGLRSNFSKLLSVFHFVPRKSARVLWNEAGYRMRL